MWLTLGVLALFAGAVGIVLPLLPTAPFVLLAAACFARGSSRYERWLLSHPHFGPPLRQWRAHHVIPKLAKWLASLSMLASNVLVWQMLSALPAALISAACAAVAIWMWSCPSRPPAVQKDAPDAINV